jgi:primosomal replication protein N
LALGAIVTELERIGPGTELAVQGFLAPARKGSKTLLLHITGFDRTAGPA